MAAEAAGGPRRRPGMPSAPSAGRPPPPGAAGLTRAARAQVTRAVADQMAVLNTNVRYLHGNLVSHAEALVASMPEPLQARMSCSTFRPALAGAAAMLCAPAALAPVLQRMLRARSGWPCAWLWRRGARGVAAVMRARSCSASAQCCNQQQCSCPGRTGAVRERT